MDWLCCENLNLSSPGTMAFPMLLFLCFCCGGSGQANLLIQTKCESLGFTQPIRCWAILPFSIHINTCILHNIDNPLVHIKLPLFSSQLKRVHAVAFGMGAQDIQSHCSSALVRTSRLNHEKMEVESIESWIAGVVLWTWGYHPITVFQFGTNSEGKYLDNTKDDQRCND